MHDLVAELECEVASAGQMDKKAKVNSFIDGCTKAESMEYNALLPELIAAKKLPPTTCVSCVDQADA